MNTVNSDNEITPLEKRNARLVVLANGAQGLGDQLVAGKTVMPWLFSAAGVPAFFTALLVPIRESGAMLPQAALTPWVTTYKRRAWIFVAGSIGQGISAALIALAALFLPGWALGIAVIALLAALSLFRALCSLVSKDVLGRTVPEGRRGMINGQATTLSGAITLVVGIVLSLLQGGLSTAIIAVVVAVGALGWFLAAAFFHFVEEPAEIPQEHHADNSWWDDTWGLFRHDSNFRIFVIVRSLMLVSALSTAFLVTLSQEIGHSIAGLGIFVVASALASLLGGSISGWLSDRSSRNVMAAGAAIASVSIILAAASAHFSPDTLAPWVLPSAFFIIQLAHTAVRVGRKTYIVDVAEGDQRTRYTGSANTLMGVVLLLVGAISGGIAMLGATAALLFLAVIGFLGVAASRKLQDHTNSHSNPAA